MPGYVKHAESMYSEVLKKKLVELGNILNVYIVSSKTLSDKIIFCWRQKGGERGYL